MNEVGQDAAAQQAVASDARRCLW